MCTDALPQWLQGDTKLSAVVHWLRLKATSPAPPAARSASSSSKRARRFPTAGQQPAQQAQHAAQQAQQADSSASSISDPAASLVGGLHAEAVAPSIAPSMAASPAANLPAAAAALDIASSSGAVSAQQEHTYMDMLSQWRSNMFEDIALLIPDELPAAGMPSGKI